MKHFTSYFNWEVDLWITEEDIPYQSIMFASENK